MFAIILHRKFSLLDATHIHNELFHKRCPYSSIEKGLVFFSLLFNSCIPVCVCLLNVQTFCKHYLDKFLSKTFIIIVFRWQWPWEIIILYIDKTNCTIPYIAYLESINSYHGINWMLFNPRSNLSISRKEFWNVSKCIF